MRSLYGELPPLAQLAQGMKTNTASRGFLRAWSVAEHRIVWEAQTATSWDGGVLATGGGLVFQGDANGNLNAYSADKGEKLAGIALGSFDDGGADHLQGQRHSVRRHRRGLWRRGHDQGVPLDPESAAYKYGNDGRIIALKIGGPHRRCRRCARSRRAPSRPRGPPTPQQIAAGEVLYNRYCSRCHVMGRGNLPDLRRLSPATHELFNSIVLGGAYSMKGMGRFDDVLSPADAESIHAWLIDQAWQLKTAPAKPAP